MRFVKMNGCGNDYVYFDLTSREAAAKGADIIRAVPRISDRHFGVGGDGVVLILLGGVADVRMRMFNADGSEGRMCGNAIRCVGKYAYENGLTDGRTEVTVETASGVKRLSLLTEGGVCTGASVSMGRAEFGAADIPIDESFLPEGYHPEETPYGRVWKDIPLRAFGQTWTGTAVSTVAALLIAVLGWFVLTESLDWLLLIPFAMGVFGNILDSVFGAVFENKGRMSKYTNNCSTALIGAVLGVIIYLAI